MVRLLKTSMEFFLEDRTYLKWWTYLKIDLRSKMYRYLVHRISILPAAGGKILEIGTYLKWCAYLKIDLRCKMHRYLVHRIWSSGTSALITWQVVWKQLKKKMHSLKNPVGRCTGNWAGGSLEHELRAFPEAVLRRKPDDYEHETFSSTIHFFRDNELFSRHFSVGSGF